MTTQILSKTHLSRLLPVLEDGAGNLRELRQIIERTSSALTSSLHPEGLTSLFEGSFDDVEDCHHVFRALVRLAVLFDHRKFDEATAIDTLARALRLDVDSTPYQALQDLAAIANTKAVKRAVKLGWLAYDHSSSLQDSNIVIDMRPVFDDARTEAVSFILLSTFQFVATDKYGTQSRSYVIDSHEISRLRDACDHALKKIEVLQSVVLDRLGAEAYVPGSDEQNQFEMGED